MIKVKLTGALHAEMLHDLKRPTPSPPSASAL